jgi:UDP-N-acetylmuramoyl-L-alanyl-D-glutamate--2,6-diaminopimelate ligase
MLRESGKKVGMMTTISVDYGDGKGAQDNPSRLTTFGAERLVSALTRMKHEGVEYLVLEVTSHALHQYRVWGIPIHVAVFTNLGHEHLDYHGTFENYRDAKRRLFKLANKNKRGLRVGIVNSDDGVSEYFAGDVQNPVRYGVKTGDVRATNIKLTSAGSRYQVKYDGREYHVECHLPGSFNVYNSLAALGVGHVLGLTKDQIEKGIASLRSVEGRMTRVDEGQDFAVIVDYAHTPESFDKLFAEVRPLAEKRLICVFGSAGRRDEEKRAKQGAIAGKWCDIVIVTEEDDRDIDGEMIMRQIVEGAESSGKVLNKDVLMVHKREEAVQMAINVAKKGDLVILLGKGHEKSILYNGPQAAELSNLPQDDGDERRVLKRAYDEVTVAREAINNKV